MLSCRLAGNRCDFGARRKGILDRHNPARCRRQLAATFPRGTDHSGVRLCQPASRWPLGSRWPVQPVIVVPTHPLRGFPFDLPDGFPRSEVFDDFGLGQSDGGFGQRVVAAVPDASNRRKDLRLSETY